MGCHPTSFRVLADGDASGQVLVWSMCLIFFVVLLFVAMIYLRKRLSPHEEFHGEGFTLSDLRRLHKSGQMSDDEYERAKEVLIGSLKSAGAKVPPADQNE